ncbi:MAG: septum formation initiator family protein [Rhodospirillaceae bacterium]|nr:septum formation initiator family protein [Rhodospirillaceae bacterium]
MSLFSELKLRGRHIIGPVLGICAISYFGYHAINGHRGLLALRQLTHRVEMARLQFNDINAERQILENRVRMLSPGSLDADMLDERARIMLNYGYADDIVVLPDITVFAPESNSAKNSVNNNVGKGEAVD